MTEFDGSFAETTHLYFSDGANEVGDSDMGGYYPDDMATSGVIATEVAPEIDSAEIVEAYTKDGVLDTQPAFEQPEYERRRYNSGESRAKLKEVYAAIWDKVDPHEIKSALSQNEHRTLAVFLSDVDEAEIAEIMGFTNVRSLSQKYSSILRKLGDIDGVRALVPENLLRPEGSLIIENRDVVGQDIAALREDAGLTQEQAAAIAKVNDVSIIRLERGRAYPDPGRVEYYLQMWGIDEDTITDVMADYIAARNEHIRVRESEGTVSGDDVGHKRAFIKELARCGVDVALLLPSKARALREAVPLLTSGKTPKQIADALGVSELTAHAYSGRIVRQLAQYEGLVPPDLLKPVLSRSRPGIGMRLRGHREAAGVTREAMLEKVGGSLSRLIRFERGDNLPGRWIVEKYLNQLDVTQEVVDEELAVYDEQAAMDRRLKANREMAAQNGDSAEE